MNLLRELASAPPEIRRNARRRVGTMLAFDCLIAVLLFASAGSLVWLYGWLYAALMVAIQLSGLFFLPLEVLAERGSKKENSEKWDRTLQDKLPGYREYAQRVRFRLAPGIW